MRCLVALFLFAGVVAAQTTSPAPKGAIHGVVTDSTGAPVSEVAVTADVAAPDAMITADGTAILVTHRPPAGRTDETGNYSLNGLRAGTYSVTPECAPGPKRVKLAADQNATLDFVCPANLSISGHVKDHNGDPAVDAFVWILKSEYQGGVLKQIVMGPKITGEDGAYSFDTGLEPNRSYYVVVDRDVPADVIAAPATDLNSRVPIEVPTYDPSATRLDAATAVVLQPGENRAKVDIEIASGVFECVSGKIAISGAPASVIFGVQDVALAGTRLVRLHGESGADGSYHVCGLPVGSYRLFTDDAFTEFAVSGSDLEHVDLAADPAHLRLRVDWGDPPPPVFDADGEAILRWLAPMLGMGDSPSADDLDRLAIRLRQETPTEEMRGLALRLAQTHEFTDERLAAFSRQLWARPNNVGATLVGTTNGFSEGLTAPVPCDLPFRNGIPAGDYLVQVHSFGPGFGYAKEVDYDGTKVADGILRVPPGAEGTVHIVIAHNAAAVAAHVTDSDNAAVPNATVIVVPDSVTSVAMLSRMALHGQADQSGDYATPGLAPGKYRLLATTQPIRWVVPDDLEKVLLVLFQAKEVELDGKATVQIALQPIPVY